LPFTSSHIMDRAAWRGMPRLGVTSIVHMTAPTMAQPAIGRLVLSFPGRAQPSPYAETPRGAVPRRLVSSVLQFHGIFRDLTRGIAARDAISQRLDAHRGRVLRGDY
jgi:hypothetical protein